MRIVLFTERNSPFGNEFLRRICGSNRASLVAVVTRPDGVCTFDYPIDCTDIAATAVEFGVPVLRPFHLREASAHLRSMAADYFFVANYQTWLPPSIYDLAKRFCLNFHVGPLPRYAGLIPWHWMWRNHETRGGVVVIRLSETLDAGDILEEQPIQIEMNWTEEDIRDQHFRAAYHLLDRILNRLPDISVTDFRPQDLSERSYYNRSGLVREQCGNKALVALEQDC